MGRRVEVIEIPTEQLSYVPGRHADRIGDRWSGTWRRAVVLLTRPTAMAPRTAFVESSPSMAGAGIATFRRMIDVPGCRLPVVLRAWWQQPVHGDDCLRLDVPRPVGGAWSITGVFRTSPISRRLPVELLLSPYLERWTMLELVPRRTTRPNRVYFRAGHRSLDWFVAAIRAQDVRAAANRQDGASSIWSDGGIGEGDVVTVCSSAVPA